MPGTGSEPGIAPPAVDLPTTGIPRSRRPSPGAVAPAVLAGSCARQRSADLLKLLRVLGRELGGERTGEGPSHRSYINRCLQAVYQLCKHDLANAIIAIMRVGVSPVAGRRPLLTTGAAARLALPRGDDPQGRPGGRPSAVRLGENGHLRISADALEDWLQPAQPEEPAR